MTRNADVTRCRVPPFRSWAWPSYSVCFSLFLVYTLMGKSHIRFTYSLGCASGFTRTYYSRTDGVFFFHNIIWFFYFRPFDRSFVSFFFSFLIFLYLFFFSIILLVYLSLFSVSFFFSIFVFFITFYFVDFFMQITKMFILKKVSNKVDVHI